MTELNHAGITKALSNLTAASNAVTDASARAAAAVYATPPGQAPADPAPAPAAGAAGAR